MSPINYVQVWLICVLTFVLAVACITQRPEWFEGDHSGSEYYSAPEQ
jgi:hypothetical protein